MMRDRTIEERKQAFAALNAYVTAQGGWLTSVPCDVEFRMQALPDGPLLELLRSAGYIVSEIATSQRVLPHAIRQQFAAGKDGEMKPLVAGSTRPVAMTVTHASIVAVVEYDLIQPDVVPDQRMRIARL